jgi:hypothetical protein
LTDPDGWTGALTVAYYASAEGGAYRALGWPLPDYTVDLFAEFRNLTNGLALPAGRSLVGAMVWTGLDPHGTANKEEISEAVGISAWRGRYFPEEIMTIARRMLLPSASYFALWLR